MKGLQRHVLSVLNLKLNELFHYCLKLLLFVSFAECVLVNHQFTLEVYLTSILAQLCSVFFSFVCFWFFFFLFPLFEKLGKVMLLHEFLSFSPVSSPRVCSCTFKPLITSPSERNT